MNSEPGPRTGVESATALERDAVVPLNAAPPVATGPAALTPALYLDHLRREAAQFSAVLRGGDPRAPVAACPGWDLAALGRHLGGMHRWSADAVRTSAPGVEPPGPAKDADLADWFDEGAADLLALLAATEPTQPCWHFGPKPRTAGFWFRRQALETLVHRWDAESAVGAGASLDPELAYDGLREIAEIYLPREVRLGRRPPLDASIAFNPTGAPGAAIVVHGDGLGDLPGAPDVTITGPAGALLLLAWGRAALDSPGLAVTGNAGAARSILDLGLVP